MSMMMTKSKITNATPGVHPVWFLQKTRKMRKVIFKTVVKDSKEEYFKGITLEKDDLIKDGGRRIKVSTFLKRYGKKGVIELLPYYDLDEDILEEYHIHLQTPAEKARREKEQHLQETAEQNQTNVRMGVENTLSATDVTVEIEEVACEDALNTSDCVEKDENEWTSSRYDYENYVLYDPEDDAPDTNDDRIMMAKGGMHPYWSDGVFHMGTASYF